MGLGLTAAGQSVGVLVSVLLARAMRTMLYDVAPTNARVCVAVSAALCAVACLASYIPARRAALVDPMTALRQE